MTRPARVLGLTVVALVAAAVALWAASRLEWVSASWDTPLRGRVIATADGAATEPVLVPWALLSLAAVAGVLATSGWGRRVVGAVVAVAGLWALLQAVTGLATPPADALPDAAREAGRLAGVEVGVVGPVLATFGAVLLGGAGVLVAVTAERLPRLGARYEAPGAREEAARARPADPDRELWTALDAGRDPTDPSEPTNRTAPPTTPPVGGPRGDRSDRSPRGEGGAG